MMMITVSEMFGDGWREVDATALDYPERKQYFPGALAMQERRTFGMGATAILRALCRLDDGGYDMRHKRYQRLVPGLFTVEDMAAAFVEWLRCERYIYGFGRGCGELMKEFFAPFLDGEETLDPVAAAVYPVDVPQIFEAILDAVQAAEQLPVHHQVGSPTHAIMDQLFQNIGTLARAGYEITRQAGLVITQ